MLHAEVLQTYSKEDTGICIFRYLIDACSAQTIEVKGHPLPD